jgi:cholesterol transport system auxiliary component
MKTLITSIAVLVTLYACSFGPKESGPTHTYDFGLQKPPTAQTAGRITSSLAMQDVSAPSWLNNPAIYYRLAYQDATRPQAYANSRWIASPAALLGLRLRQSIAAATEGGMATSLDGAKGDYNLRLELEEFCQVFDSAKSSHVVVRLRATLVAQASRNLVAQKSFIFERPAPSANADGAVKALVGASDELVAAVVEWLATQTALGKKES